MAQPSPPPPPTFLCPLPIWEWVAQGRVGRSQLQALEAHGQLSPSAQDWRALVMKLLLWGGCACLTAGIVFFFAFNWDALTRLQKIGIAASAVGLSALLTLCTRVFSSAWQAGCFVCSMGIGALLALIGQTYQTGADTWQLFAMWLLCMLPICLLARSATNWILALILGNLALGLFLSSARSPLLMALANERVFYAANGLLWVLAMLGAKRLLAQPAHSVWLTRACLLAFLIPLSFSAMRWHLPSYLAVLILAGVIGWLQRPRADFASLVLASCAGLVVTNVIFLQLNAFGSNLYGASLTASAVVLLGSCFLTVKWLLKKRPHPAQQDASLAERENTTERTTPALAATPSNAEAALVHAGCLLAPNTAKPESEPLPWWSQTMLSIAAWVSSLFLSAALFTFIAITTDRITSSATLTTVGLVGLALTILSIVQLRRANTQVFAQQFWLALSLCGQLSMVLASLDQHNETQVLLFGAVVTFVASLPRTTSAHRSICLGFAIGLLCAWWVSTRGSTLWILPLLVIGCLAIWLTRPHWAFSKLQAYGAAFAQASLVLCLLYLLFLTAAFDSVLIHLRGDLAYFTAPNWWNSSGIYALIWLATAAYLAFNVKRTIHNTTAHRGERANRATPMALALAAGMALAASALCNTMPHMLLALALALAMFQMRKPIWFGVFMALAVGLFSFYYYHLGDTLLHKSLYLMAVGALFILGYACLHFIAKQSARASSASPTKELA